MEVTVNQMVSFKAGGGNDFDKRASTIQQIEDLEHKMTNTPIAFLMSWAEIL